MLAACGGGVPAPEDEATQAAEQAEDEALGRDTDATVLDDMIQTQDRARGVEDLTLGRKDDLDQALEASGDPRRRRRISRATDPRPAAEHPMQRIPEPELMDEAEQARAYAQADFAEPNQRFVDCFEAEFPELQQGAVLDLGCGPGDIVLRLARGARA